MNHMDSHLENQADPNAPSMRPGTATPSLLLPSLLADAKARLHDLYRIEQALLLTLRQIQGGEWRPTQPLSRPSPSVQFLVESSRLHRCALITLAQSLGVQLDSSTPHTGNTQPAQPHTELREAAAVCTPRYGSIDRSSAQSDGHAQEAEAEEFDLTAYLPDFTPVPPSASICEICGSPS